MSHNRPAQSQPTYCKRPTLTSTCTTSVRGLGIAPATGIAQCDRDLTAPSDSPVENPPSETVASLTSMT